MMKLTVDKTNLLSIYKTGSRQRLIIAKNTALRFMDGKFEALPPIPSPKWKP